MISKGLARLLCLGLCLGSAATLAACSFSPNTQQGESTALAGGNNIQISGVIVQQNSASGGASATQVAAAKARVPHQFKTKKPLNLFDFGTNWNPGSNR